MSPSEYKHHNTVSVIKSGLDIVDKLTQEVCGNIVASDSLKVKKQVKEVNEVKEVKEVVKEVEEVKEIKQIVKEVKEAKEEIISASSSYKRQKTSNDEAIEGFHL